MVERVLVVGASGALGRVIAARLVAGGASVRGMTRDAARLADLAAQGAEVVEGDLLQPATLASAPSLRPKHGSGAVRTTSMRSGSTPRADTMSAFTWWETATTRRARRTEMGTMVFRSRRVRRSVHSGNIRKLGS